MSKLFTVLEFIFEAGRGIAWVIAFFVTWGYCIATYGLLLGGVLGWFPALLIALVAAFLWPLAALIGAVVLVKAMT